jgi:hypothetical protein
VSEPPETPENRSQATAPRWKGSQSLELVYRYNERCLGLLCGPNAGPIAARSLAIAANLDLLRNLDRRNLGRAARLPFVIMDLRFADGAWWRDLLQASPFNAGSPAILTPEAESPDLVIARETVMFAWQTARWDRSTAQLSFGMSTRVVEVISHLSPAQVTEISSTQSDELRLRWDDDLKFWRDLLLAAASSDADLLDDILLHAKLQLLRGIWAADST